MRALVILALLATPVFADDTFEAKADGALLFASFDGIFLGGTFVFHRINLRPLPMRRLPGTWIRSSRRPAR